MLQNLLVRDKMIQELHIIYKLNIHDYITMNTKQYLKLFLKASDIFSSYGLLQIIDTNSDVCGWYVCLPTQYQLT